MWYDFLRSMLFLTRPWAPKLRVARRLLCRGIARPAALEGITQGRRPGLLWGDFALQGTSKRNDETKRKESFQFRNQKHGCSMF